MAITTQEARQQILDDLAAATDQIAMAVASLGAAFELLPVGTGERLEDELFRPVQKAYGRAKRTHSAFAERCGLAARAFELPGAGTTSQGAKGFVAKATGAVAEADRLVAELQDSLLPIEAGDAELRSGLSEVRELLAGESTTARQFLRALGR